MKKNTAPLTRIDPFFNPRSIVVIGVSLKRLNLGKIIVLNNKNIGFKGNIYGVGKEEGDLEGTPVFDDIRKVPEIPDVAIIITPAPTIPGVMRQCGEKGIKHIVIESGGFSEYSQDKGTLEQEVLDIAGEYDMRIIGPNCIGAINNELNLMMPFTFQKNKYPSGHVSIISQSGGVGDSYMRIANENHVFFNKFVAVGNKLDLDEVDFLNYFIHDKKTSAVFMYLEGFSRGRAFFDTAMGSGKPLVVQKSNRSSMSSSIAQSHTAALSASDDVVGSALHQAAVVRVKSEDELIIAAKALQLPVMKGNRVAVLSRSGGHAVITVDACAKYGFELVEFTEEFIDTITSMYETSIIAHQNPLDLGEIFDYTIFIRILEAALQLEDVDGVIFNHLYQASYEAEMSRTFLDGVSDLVKKYNKPVAVTLISDADEILDVQKNHPYPAFNTPLQTVSALWGSRYYYMRRELRDNRGSPIEYPINKDTISAIVKTCTREERIPLTHEALAICEAAGIVPVKQQIIKDFNDCTENELNYPCAVKLLSRDASHKSDIGGVKLNLHSPGEISDAILEITETVKNIDPVPAVDGFLVQEMAPPGEEFFIGARQDMVFGPIIIAGFGGIFIEILRDRAIRLGPVTEREAYDMLEQLKMYPVLKGTRGKDPLDIDALVGLICRVSWLISNVDCIDEIDLNPVIVHPAGSGVSVVDSRVFFKS